MPELLIYKSIIVALLLLGLFVAEHYAPAVAVPDSIKASRRVLKNLSLWLGNSFMSPLIVLPITLYAVSWDGGWSGEWNWVWDGSWRSSWLDGWGGLLLDILLLDFWIYWWHRVNHRLPLLWRFHQVHHLDQWLDVTSAVRFHFGEVILSALVRGLVIVSLGMPLSSVIVFETLVLLGAGFHHSNLRLPIKFERALSKVIITPSVHWVHHHVTQQDTDSNYGALFSFWDRLFGSKSESVRTANMNIGLDQRNDKELLQLLLEPFRRSS